MINTGVLMARHPGALALVDAWANRTAAKHSCTSWGCGDQEQLTALLVECGWKAPTLQGDESRGSSDRPHRHVLSCFGGTSIVALPPSRFANGFEWNPKEGRRPSVRRADDPRRQRVITFHPNFNGGAPSRLEKSSLRPRVGPCPLKCGPRRVGPVAPPPVSGFPLPSSGKLKDADGKIASLKQNTFNGIRMWCL
jgi:hypothetical protein